MCVFSDGSYCHALPEAVLSQPKTPEENGVKDSIPLCNFNSPGHIYIANRHTHMQANILHLQDEGRFVVGLPF